MLTKDGKDVEIININAINFNVPKGEEHLYHVKIEVRKFNQETGERISRPRVQVFGVKEFETTAMNELKKHGYTVDILHNPKEWIEQQNAIKAGLAEKMAAERQKAMQEKKAADDKANAEAQQKAIDEAVAKALEAQAAENQKAIDKAIAAAIAKTNKKADESGK